ncbi:unnamed protein product, partial [Phaeothamnion confervicola]
LAILGARVARASNWAQLTGDRVQNYAIPYADTVGTALFTPREAMAVAVYNASAELADEYGQLLVLGGDDYVEELTDELASRGGQYRNDVWSTGGLGWSIYDSGSKPVPKTTMEWTKVNSGKTPPPGVTYDAWIQCQAALVSSLSAGVDCTDLTVAPGSYLSDNMWAPRRDHCAAVINNVVYVLGGRARELQDYSRARAVGGAAASARVAPDPFHANWREASVLKNDVWASNDAGASWTLITPGCRDPQRDLVLAPGDIADGGAYGTAEAACSSDGDCYGAAVCRVMATTAAGTCVCPLWSPREGHAVVAYGGRMYVVGGFASVHRSRCGSYACGDIDAGSYRRYMNDVWYSEDGAYWTVATLTAPWRGRGGHAATVIDGSLFILGGATAAATATTTAAMTGSSGEEVQYLNDVWWAPLAASTSDDAMVMETWTAAAPPPWSPRAGHAAVMEEAAAINAFEGRLYVIGGHDATGPLSDSWSIAAADAPTSGSSVSVSAAWDLDYAISQPYRSAQGNDSGFLTGNNPSYYYLDSNSPIEMLLKVYLPTLAPAELGPSRVVRTALVSESRLQTLRSVGIHTVGDLATADQYTVLKLRGYDYPQVPTSERLTLTSICDIRQLAVDFLAGCTVDYMVDLPKEELSQPAHVTPVFGGSRPVTQLAKWYGVDYTVAAASSSTDETAMVEKWDGCTKLDGIVMPDVPGIGLVAQVSQKWRRTVW